MKKIRRILKQLRFQTLKSKFIFSFLIIGLLPLLVFALFSYYTYLGALENRISEYSTGMVKRMQENIDDYLNDVNKVLNMKNDYYLNQFIKLFHLKDYASARKYTFRLWEDFNNLTRLKPGVEDIALTFRDGRRISTYGIYFSNYSSQALYRQINNVDKNFLVSKPHLNFMNKMVVSICKKFDPVSGEKDVMISADISIDMLQSITDIKLSNQSFVFIFDKNGNIIYHPQQELIGEHLEDYKTKYLGVTSTLINGEKYIVNHVSSELTGWNYISLAPAHEISSELIKLKKFTLVIIGLILLGITLLTIYLSSTLTKPIIDLEKLTKKAANNNLNVKIETRGNDEIARLGSSFNKMITRIKRLMEKNIEEQKQIRHLEMESLQNQIKPHFIYNTLELIIGHLESNKRKKASSLVEALGNFFRLSLSYGEEMVMVRNELEHVRNYLYIQQQRFEEGFEYFLDIKDKDVLDFYLPKLLLQPLVENAIYHGVLKIDRKGLIIIKCQRDINDIVFEVIDNGHGIPANRVEEINTILRGEIKVKDKKKYFGLRNVNNRIKLKFGNNYGLKVDSIEDKETRVIVRIGLLRDKNF